MSGPLYSWQLPFCVFIKPSDLVLSIHPQGSHAFTTIVEIRKLRHACLSPRDHSRRQVEALLQASLYHSLPSPDLNSSQAQWLISSWRVNAHPPA